MRELLSNIELKGRQLLAAGVATVGILGGTACESTQIKLSLEHCSEQPNVEHCLGQLASLASSQKPIMSEASFMRVVEINSTMAPSDSSLLRLRQCESTNRYNITNKSGKYMGAYQFDQRTWNNTAKTNGLAEFVGQNPHRTPAAVQDAMARGLYSQRGRSPWPECGRRI